ncbi:MAG TPA: metallophosphoesterase [Chthoniobacterales bacterium]|jgi:predicted phosphodiesterase|nr:metallophosphoesterase [Chthoniobacterales bacterium]
MNLTPTDPTLILSDLHLGHRASLIRDPEQLAPVFREANTIVLNGDTAELRHQIDRPVGRMLAATLARVCHSSGAKAIFINGNHDPVISHIDHLDLAEGQMLVTHGDMLFLGIAPWSRQAYAYRKIHLRALDQLGPDALLNFEKRLLATKRTSLKLQLLEEPTTQGRFPGLGLIVRQFWPPFRPFMILHAWWETPKLGAKLLQAFRPETRYLLIGHTHFPGCWNHGGRVVINTGSFVWNFGACAVLLKEKSFEIRKIERYQKNFVLGKRLKEFAINRP